MDLLECTNCAAEFRPQDTDVITLRGTASHEMKQYCPYCHTVLSHQVTLEGDDPTIVHEAINLSPWEKALRSEGEEPGEEAA